MVATAGDHNVLGKLVRRQGCSLKLNEFDEKIAIADGAEWIHRMSLTKVFIHALLTKDAQKYDFEICN